jgi:ADP-heptose:LPS heptosyltransferase
MYHADGVVCPVTFAMHLAAAVPVRPNGRKSRPCVVIAGGREPSQWEAYPSHTFLHTCGALKCCDHGGCFKSRVKPLYDGAESDNSLCVMPVEIGNKDFLPKCMDMIAASDVIQAVERYMMW